MKFATRGQRANGNNSVARGLGSACIFAVIVIMSVSSSVAERGSDAGIAGEEQSSGASRQKQDHNFRRLNDQGLDLYLQGRFDEALILLSRAIALNPRSGLPFYNRGMVHLTRRDLAPAIADFSEAIRIVPDFALAYMNRSIAYSYRSQLDEAFGDADEAVRLAPGLADAYFNRAILWVKKRLLPQAIEDYDAAIRLKPDDAQAMAERAAAWHAMGKVDKALADYRRALEIDPSNSRASKGLHELRSYPAREH